MKLKELIMKALKIGPYTNPVKTGTKAGKDLTKALNELCVRTDTRLKVIDLINEDLQEQMKERIEQIRKNGIV